jgi:hypothetical protein
MDMIAEHEELFPVDDGSMFVHPERPPVNGISFSDPAKPPNLLLLSSLPM